MQELLSKYQHHLQRLADVQVIGQVGFVVIVLLISYSGVKVIHTNHQLQQQITRLQQENEIQRLKNENLKLRNQYYNSPQYLELAARQNFGLAQAGEKEYIVPKSVALKYAPEAVVAGAAPAANAPKQLFFQRNLQAWLDFFLHRQSAPIIE
ncbi:MAG TPA: septum formation initiator family protein [Candidatus Saccharimonadales bacterium]|nr:septum formation initiator family protein [Candidatus Saccharimonadales bacterium]